MKITKFLSAALFFGWAVAAHAEPAVIIVGDTCGVFTVEQGALGYSSTTDSKTVFSNNGNGNVTMKCKLSGVPNDSGETQHFDFESTGFVCGTQFGITENWKQVLTPSGRAVLTCHINLNY